MKPDKAIEVWAPLFTMELDASDYERFRRYTRWSVEYEKRARMGKTSPRVSALSTRGTVRGTVERVLRRAIDREMERNPEFREQYPELQDPAFFKEIVRNFKAEWKAQAKEAAKEREVRNSKVLAQFDARDFDGPDDWVYRKTFKQVVREALVEYLSDTRSGPNRPGPDELRPGLAAEALSWKALRPLRHLRTLAEQGDNKALQLLAEIVIPLVKVVNERAGREPAALEYVPQRFRFWPVLKSEHPGFDEDHRNLLKKLHVGQDFPLVIAEGARWKAQDAVGQWAIHLCHNVYIMQEGHSVEDPPKAWEKILLHLRPFSDTSWKDWWEVAKGVLQDEYIDVVDIPELRDTVTSKADLRSRGRMRKRILQALKDKFKSMAGGNKL